MSTAPSRSPLRLLAIVAAALLPMIGLLVLLLAPVNRDVAAARREQRGLEYLTAIKTFARAALDHRRTANEYIVGTSDSVQIARRAEAVDAALRDLESIDARLGGDATRSALTELRGDWEAIGTNLAAWARADNFNAFLQRSADLMRHLRQLAETASDATGLAAAPRPTQRGPAVWLGVV